ncbi:Uncharacterised protein [uncultured archaeon]|nr:Uncharacterised protein [uncultured archaeon]
MDVRVNKGAWIAATGTQSWHAAVDLSQLPDGEVEVECRARDSSGKQETSDFSFVTLIKSANVPPRTMYAIAPQAQLAPNETAVIRIQDARGHDLYGLSMRVAKGEMQNVNSPVSLVLGKSGQVEVEFEKSGFAPASAVLVGSGGFDFTLVLIAIVLVALAIAIYFLFGRALPGRHK